MGFQILDKDSNAITLHALDKEVAMLWEVKCDDTHYAVPNSREYYQEEGRKKFDYHNQINWFDSIGYVIHSKKLTNWKQVKDHFIELYQSILDEYKITLDDLEPKLVALINYWESKGYIPIPVED